MEISNGMIIGVAFIAVFVVVIISIDDLIDQYNRRHIKIECGEKRKLRRFFYHYFPSFRSLIF